MKIKLDENLPERLVAALQVLGHDVDTVRAERLTGHDDADVWHATQADSRFFITQDLDFSDVRMYTLQHGQEPDRLFRLIMGIYGGVLDHLPERQFADAVSGCSRCALDSGPIHDHSTRVHVSSSQGPPRRRACHATAVTQLTSPPVWAFPQDPMMA